MNIFIIVIVFLLLIFLLRKKIMKVFRFIKTPLFLINITLSIVLLVLVSYFSMNYLDSYTKHGEVIAVPNLIGIHVSDVEDSLEEKELRYVIRDSVYSDDYPMGMIVRQDPKPNAENFPNFVKPNRRIYLTIVKTMAEYRVIPDLLTNVTSKSIGKAKLEMQGFKVDFELKDHKDKDKILEILFNGESVEVGTSVLKGSQLTIIYGSGAKGAPVELPNLIGKSIGFASEYLNEIGLELEVAYDTIDNKLDSNKAIVYSQYPDPEKEENRVITLGSIIHVMANMSTIVDTSKINLTNE